MLFRSYQDDDGGEAGSSRGAIWLLFLNTDATVKSYQKISQTQGNFTGVLDATDGFGSSVALLSSIDGNGLTKLAAGAYQDDDGGNNKGAVWLLSIESQAESSSFSIDYTVGDVSCSGGNDGFISATVSGGTPPYYYIWSDGQITPTVINLTAGTYFVMVIDAYGATASDSITINQPQGIYVNINSTVASCDTADGTASAIAFGGVGGFQYQWDDPALQTTPIAANLEAGTYHITIQDTNLCTFFDSVAVNNPYAISANIAFTIDNTCNGDCDGFATVLGSGGVEPYTFSWSDPGSQSGITATNLCAGEYAVTVSDINECSSTVSVTISEPSPITISSSVTNALAGNCDGTVGVNVSGGTPPYYYSWDDPANQYSASATGLCPGAYTLTIWDAENCTVYPTIEIKETIPSGIASIELPDNYTVYPNPTSGELFVDVNIPGNNVHQLPPSLLNSLGREIFIKQTTNP